MNILDSITGIMILASLPAKWDHVSAIYLQCKTAIVEVTLNTVWQAIVAKFDWTGSTRQQAHCIIAVKRKGEHPKYQGSAPTNSSSKAEETLEGSSRKKTHQGGKKNKGKGKAHIAECANSLIPSL